MWNAIYKKLWIVILAPLFAGGVAYLITGKDAGQYRSVAIIEASIPDRSSGATTLKDIPEPNEYYDNLAQAMKTEVITSMASYRLLLHDLEKEIAFRPPAIQYSHEKREVIRARLQKKLASFELLSENDPTEQTIFKILTNTDYNLASWIRDKQMTVEWKEGTNDIHVATQTEDPFLSAFASNALSQEYIRYETAVSSVAGPRTNAPAGDSIAMYRDEVSRLRKDLEQKTAELDEAGKRKPRASVDEESFRREKADRIAEYEMRIIEEDWELGNLREQLAKLERPEVTESTPPPADVATNAKIQTIRKKIDQLSRMYIDGGSKDKKLDSIINRLRQQVNDETVRLQIASQKASARPSDPRVNRNREMLETRIRRHEETIASLRNDIRRARNATRPVASTNTAEITRLREAHDAAEKAYNAALATLRTAESKQPQQASVGRADHHLILKEKALPSAEPESPWALAIVLSVVVVTLAIVLIVIAVTRPAPAPYDDIFLRVNYENRRRMSEKKKHPREGDVSLSNN